MLVLTNFFCCATHSGPIFHTVSYAQLCGISAIAAVSIYSVEGFAGMFGRIGFGVMGDRFGAKRVLVAGLLAQAFGALGYFFARDLVAFYSVAAVFGFIYAGIMPLYAVLVRENFPMKMMGTIMGGTGMAGGLGMAIGPGAGRLDLRHHRRLWRALHHLLRAGSRCFRNRDDLPAVPADRGPGRRAAGLSHDRPSKSSGFRLIPSGITAGPSQSPPLLPLGPGDQPGPRPPLPRAGAWSTSRTACPNTKPHHKV